MLRAASIALLAALLWPGLAWAPPREANLVARVVFSAQPKAGEVLVVTASVQNKGPDSVLDGTLVTTLPDGLTLVAAHPTQGRCTGATTVSCSFGLLGRFNQAFDHVASVRLLVRAEHAGTFTGRRDGVCPDGDRDDPRQQHRRATGHGRCLRRRAAARPRAGEARLGDHCARQWCA